MNTSIEQNKVMQKSLKKNMLLNYIKTFMSLLFPLITFPYASRILLPDGIGKINFAQSIIQYFSIIAMLGINTYGIRECAKCRDNKMKLSKLTKELFSINLISTFVAYILFIISLFVIPKFQEYKLLLIVYSATILFTVLGMDWLYSALEEYKYITIRSIFFQILSLVLLFIFVHKKEDYLKYAAISVISNVGSNICNFVHAKKFVYFKYEGKLNFKKHLKPVFTLFALTVTTSVYTILDTTMLGFIKGDEAVGIYTAATKINKMILMVITAGSAVLLPRLSYYAKDKSKGEEFNQLVKKSFDLILTLSIPSAIGLGLIAKPVIFLFSGQNYMNAIPVMQVMTPIIVFISITNLIGIQIFMPLGKEKYTLYSVIAGAIVNFTLNAILIPIMGTIGAAIATVFAEGIVCVIQIILVKKIIPLRTIILPFLKYSLGGVIFCIPSLFINKLSPLPIYLNTILVILISFFIYLGYLRIVRNQFVMNILWRLKI